MNKNKNQSKIDSWKENKEKNIRYKSQRYKGHNYNNHSNNFFSHNKRHFKDYKSYKSPYSYNQYSNSNKNYIPNKDNYIEKEIELNSKGETEVDSDIKTSEMNEDNSEKNTFQSQENSDSNSKNNLEFSNQENTEEINSLELLNLNLMKSQSDDISLQNIDLHDVGIKLFPGAFCHKTKNYEPNKMDINNSLVNNNSSEENKKSSDLNFECNNFLCKSNSNSIKSEQKNGLALAYDYYSSFLEEKIK